jgi:glycosyltransferase involved in cell wall biosynthesis
VVVVPDPFDRAAVIAALIADPAGREEIGGEARHTAERVYDWNVIAAVQRSVYDSLLSGQPATPASVAGSR